MVFLPDKEGELRITRGSTATMEIELTAENGLPYVLLEGDVIRFGVKQGTEGGAYRILKEISEVTQGVGQFLITPEDTLDMEPGRYAYDVGLQSGEHYFMAVGFADFILEPNVTGKA